MFSYCAVDVSLLLPVLSQGDVGPPGPSGPKGERVSAWMLYSLGGRGE